MEDTILQQKSTRDYKWHVVDPARPWKPLQLTLSPTGIIVSAIHGSGHQVYPWRDVLDIGVDGVSGFWGLRMAVAIKTKNHLLLRFLCPRFPLFLYPPHRALDIADQIRHYRLKSN